MDNPKIFVSAFVVSIIVLLGLLSLQHSSTEQRTFDIVSSTLTQSLDGHRRFLTVQLDDSQTAVISAPVDNRCENAQQTTVEVETDMLGNASYRFISCQ
ncbi:hypothetical protein [Vibrio intestinalis]|uniref:hypothetical protein n=1 Tax=Vibrio intestinalis TaxID=2933291 RepID=UPI0021A7B0EE|nr:hypothetical protein [Vibrio intestinalis]